MATLNEKLKFLKGLANGERALVGPFYATVDITNRCNLGGCLCCPYQSSDAGREAIKKRGVTDIPFTLFERLCGELKDMGTREMILLGEGEPMLHPRIFDILAVAKGAGFRVTLLTNGTLLDEASSNRLIDNPPDILRVSIWAATAGEYDKHYTGTDPEYLERVLGGLKTMAALKAKRCSKKPLLDLHLPITRYNYQNIDAMVELARDTGCDLQTTSQLRTVWGRFDGMALNADEEKLVCEKLRRMKKRLTGLGIEHNVDQTIMRYDIGAEVWEKLPCYMGWVHAHIGVDGSVGACRTYELNFGNLNKKGFREIWNGPGYSTFRRETRSQERLKELSRNEYECANCPYVLENRRIHNIFKWLAPFIPALTRDQKKSLRKVKKKVGEHQV